MPSLGLPRPALPRRALGAMKQNQHND